MWLLNTISTLVLLSVPFRVYFCLPHEAVSELSMSPYPAEDSISEIKRPANALALRSQNFTAEGRIIYKDLTFLIPSHKHAALLFKMYNDIRNSIAQAINSALDLSPATVIAFRYGAFTLTVGCLWQLCGTDYLLEWALDLIGHALLVTLPPQFAVVFYALQGFMFWATGEMDGSFVDRARRNGWQ